MFGFQSPPARPGSRVPARAINRPADEAARQSRARPGGALAAISTPSGSLPYSTARRSWLVRITSVGTSSQAGQYGWQAIWPDPANPGYYQDLAGWSGTLSSDPLIEDNGNAGLTVGLHVEVQREYYSGQVRTQLAVCS